MAQPDQDQLSPSLDNDPGPAPLGGVDWLLQQRRQSIGVAISGLEGDQADAARAFQLGKSTGADPALIYGDTENFEKEHKAAIVGQMLNSNDFLRSVAESHPLAPTLAQNDWGNLDKLGEDFKRVRQLSGANILGGAVKGFSDVWFAPPGEGEGQLWDPNAPNAQANQRLYDSLSPEVQNMWRAAAGGIAQAWRAIPATFNAFGGAISGAITSLGGSEETADQIKTQALSTIQALGESEMGRVGEHFEVTKDVVNFQRQKMAEREIARQVKEVHDAIRPYLDAGQTPPVGIHPIVDAIHFEQAKLDSDSLKDLESTAHKLDIREAAPEVLEEAIGRHVRDQTIGIKSEAIRKLYGDKQIEAGDGLLGDVKPPIAEQMILAGARGGDVEVPLASWLTRVEPDVQKALHDDIRVRRGGITLSEVEEAKELGEARRLATETPEQERIVGAAIRAGDKIFSGSVHSSAWANAADAGVDMSKLALDDVDGFLTSTGRYVSREEGAKIADAASQRMGGGERLESGQLTPGYFRRLATETPTTIPSEDPKIAGVIDKLTKSIGDKTLNQAIKELSADESLTTADLKKILASSPSSTGLATSKDRAGLLDEIHATYVRHARFLNKVGTETIPSDDILRPPPGVWPQLYPKDPIQVIRHSIGHPLENAVVKGIIPPNAVMETSRLLDERHGAGSTASPPLLSFLAKDALNMIDKSLLTDPATRELAEFIHDRLYRAVGDVKIRIVPGVVKDMASLTGTSSPAFYDFSANEVFMSQEWAEGKQNFPRRNMYGHQYAAAVLTEELAHAATAREMFNTPALRNRVEALRQYTLDWLQRNAPDRAAFHDYELSNEYEFIAWAWHFDPQFKQTLAQIPLSPTLSRGLGYVGGLASVWDSVRAVVRDSLRRVFGKLPTESVLDAVLRLGPEFDRINTMIRKREGEGPQLTPQRGPRGESIYRTQDPLEDRMNALGIKTKERREAYRKMYEDAIKEDGEWQLKQGEKEERQRQTKEWKEDRIKMKQDVDADLKQRPDLAAQLAFRDGEWNGAKLKGKPKFDPATLTDEQKAGLPPEYIGGHGARSPDQWANAFGYATGDDLVDGLVRLKREQDDLGLTSKEHYRQMLEAETDRQMKLVHGNLEANIMEDAKEHVLGPSTMALMNEELFALAAKAGVKPQYTKENVKAWVQAEFDKQLVGNHDHDKYMADAKRAGDKLEGALLKDDAAGAFKAKEQQIVATHMAGMAKKLQKQVDADTRLRERKAKLEPSGDPETNIWTQDLLARTGTFVKRTVQGMARQKELVSTAASFPDFVNKINEMHDVFGYDPDTMAVLPNVPVAKFLLDDPNYRKTVPQMTVEEFRAVAGSIKALDVYGRDIGKYNVRGDLNDLQLVVKGLIERAQAFAGDRKITPGETAWWRQAGSRLLNPETWVNKIDLFNPMGPYNQLLIRPVLEGSYESLRIRKEMAKDWRELGYDKIPDMGKLINNPLFKERNGDERVFTKENALAVLANMGNELQRKKLAAGFGIKDPQLIWNWLSTVLTKDDMDRQAKMGEFWEKYFKQSEEMYSRVKGYIPDRIELGQISTPWGVYKEWYHPLIPDAARRSPGLKVSDIMDDTGYFRPSPASGYTKGRTGAVYPIDLTFNRMVTKAEQMANDIAMREPISQVSKIFYNRDFRDQLTHTLGVEYTQGFDRWLRDTVGQRYPGMDAFTEKVATYVKQNLSTLLIGFNLGTVLKHGITAAAFSMKEVGMRRFMDSFMHIIYETATGQERWKFANEESQELANRFHSNLESMSATNEEMFKNYTWNHKFFTVRDAIQRMGAWPVAMVDKISSNTMWDAWYRYLREEKGLDHGDAVYQANTVVRRTHGSSILANRPAIMRQGGLASTFLPFYNFFNNALQRINEYSWRSRLAMKGRELPEMTGFEKETFDKGATQLPSIMGGFLTFAVLPSLIEQLIDPLPDDSKENKLWHWGKVLIRGPSSTIPIARDLINGVLNNTEASVGLVGVAANDLIRGLTTAPTKDPSKTVRRWNEIVGVLTGMTYEQAGKILQYVTSHEHPKGISDVYHGIRRGTQIERRR